MMQVKFVELTGFRGVSPHIKFNFEPLKLSEEFLQNRSFPVFLYKSIFGILFGFSDEQKKLFRHQGNQIKTFTGLVKIQINREEFLIERDFETDFVAYVALKKEKIKTIYQGKDVPSNGSHKVFIKTIKDHLPYLLDSINQTIHEVKNKLGFEFNRAEFNNTASLKQPSNVYFLPTNKALSKKSIIKFQREDHPALFFEVFNKTDQAIFLWMLNEKGKPESCVKVNSAAHLLTGYDEKSLYEKQPSDLFIDIDQSRFGEKIQQQDVAKTQFLEATLLTKEGRKKSVKIKFETVQISGQKYLLNFVKELEIDKDWVNTFKELEANYQILFNTIPVPLFLLNKNKIINCNTAAEDLLSKKRSTLKGKDIQEIFSFYQEESAKKIDFLQIIKTLPGKNGQPHLLVKATFEDNSKQSLPIQVIGLNSPNQYVLIGKALPTHEAKSKDDIKKRIQYQNFVKNPLVGFWHLELPQPVPINLPPLEIAKKIFYEGRFVEVNDAFVNMYHKKNAGEIIGHSPAIFSVNHDQSLENLQEFVKNNFKIDLKETVEKIDDNKVSYFNNSFFGYVEKGYLHWLWGIQIDITRQKELEEQFLQSQKMEAIGMLAGGIAHDFNNILTVINGYADMMTRRIKADNPLFKYINQIRQAGERASHLTSQLLSFSRRQVFQTKVIDLNRLIKSMISMIQRIIGEHIEVITHLSADLNTIQFDENKIEQIILNLAVNAKDAMPRGGKLILETRNVTVTEEYCVEHPEFNKGEYVLLAISDNGVGIDPKNIKRIFEPFFTTKEKGVGTGLGLATVYGIVKQAKGHITVQSKVGQGTTFFIYFPKASSAQSILDDVEQEDVQLLDDFRGNETIMVVEDDTTVRQVMVETLQSQGYRVLEAMDGSEALEIFALSADQIDLIISDIVMPRVNGVEFYMKILKSKPDVKFIFISGYSDNDILSQADLINIEFVQKPFKLNELLKRIRRVLNNANVKQS